MSRCWRWTVVRTGWRSSRICSLRWLCRRDARKLRPGGRVYLEIGAGQGDAARTLVQDLLPDAEVAIVQDYADLDRLLIVALPGAASQRSTR